MTLRSNPSYPSPTLPTLAEIQRRTRELLAHHNRQKSAQSSGTPADPHFEEDIRVLEEFMQQHEEQHETPEFDEPYTVAEPEPAPMLPPSSSAPRPPALDGTSLHGIAGVLVRTLAPHTEADPAAVLLQFLAAFGNLLGPGPHCRVGATRHGLNLFVILVGESSKARKGTSWRQISSLFAEADPSWSSRCVTATRPTPNTIFQALRDQQPVTDRRLFLLSEEFASVIHVLGREAGQLSPLLRTAWDGGNLCSHDGHRYVQATAAHISLVGHVTQSELAHHLSHIESHNGFANRCLWTSVRRSQSLPDGGSLPPEQHALIAGELRRTLDWVQAQDELLFSRTPAARELWNDGYVALSQGRADAYRLCHQPRRSPGPSPERHLRGPGSHPAHRCLPPPGRLGCMGLLPRQCSPSLRHRPYRSHRPTHQPGGRPPSRGTNQNANSRSFPSPCKQRAN